MEFSTCTPELIKKHSHSCPKIFTIKKTERIENSIAFTEDISYVYFWLIQR